MAVSLVASLLFYLLCLCQDLSLAVREDCDVSIRVLPSSLPLQVGGPANCNMVTSESSGVNEYECDTIDIALLMASNITAINCTQIYLLTGRHIITSVFSFDQNILLIGTGQVEVAFNISSSVQASLDKYEPLYILEFRRVEYVGISQISFTDSPGIVGIFNSTQIEIENCSFSYFTEGSMDIYDSISILIRNCSFLHNGPVTNVLKRLPYSIHSGGLSIAIDSLPSTSEDIRPEIHVENCYFFNNSAIPTKELIRSTNDIFQRNIFTGRGGGLGITLHSSHKTIHCYVENCLFEENTSGIWGGGLYVLFGTGSNHTVVTSSSVFIDNGSGSAGGLFVGTLETGTPDAFSSSYILHCEFYGNHADNGGATVWPVAGIPSLSNVEISNYAQYENCTFVGNRANHNSALSLVTVDTFNTQTSHRPVEIINCTFIDNRATDSPAFSSTFVPVLFKGRNTFERNIGGAIELVGAIVTVQGDILISSSVTVGTNRAAFQISSFGQIMLLRGAELVFNNNTGSFGAALISVSRSLSISFKNLIYNPLCFLLYEDFRATPNEWTDVRMSFTGNKAIVGAAAYTDDLDTCSWSQLKRPFFDTSQVLRWNFIDFGENINTFHDSDTTNPLWYVQTSAVEVNSIDNIIYAYPGEQFQINVSVIDELGQAVSAPIRTMGTKFYNDSQTSISLTPEVGLYINRSRTLTKRAYIHTGEDSTGTYELELRNIFNLRTKESTLQIVLNSCPPGFVLTDIEGESDFSQCQCNYDNSDIVTCMDRRPMFDTALWATTDDRRNDQLGLYACPIGYCRCNAMEGSPNECLFSFDVSNPNDQCNCKRKGVLCGECRNGAGVSALLNRCTTCHDAHSILIVALDTIILIVMLRYFMCANYPALLLPCIFYIQYLPFGTEVFQEEFQYMRPYLYYVASALSFYFPYDFCLYSNTSSLVVYTLKLIPLILTLIITPTLLVLCWRFVMKLRNNNWNLIWLLLLLVYPLSVHTALNILNCPLVYINGTLDSRWYIDGSVQCFRGGHAPLGLLAILILFLSVAIIPTVIALAYKDYQNPIWLRRLQRPLRIWFKSQYRWWYGVELGRRLILLLVLVPFPGNRHPAFIVFCISMGLFLYVRPYSSSTANWLEFIYSVITFLLYLLFLSDTPVLFNESSYVTQTEGEMCSNKIDTFSVFSILGGILYLTPLLISSIVLIVWASIKIYRHTKLTLEKKQKVKKLSRKKNRGISDALEIQSKRTTYLRKAEDGDWIHEEHSGSTSRPNNDSNNVLEPVVEVEMRNSVLSSDLDDPSPPGMEQSSHLDNM